MITSFFDGRVRIKAEALRNENNMAAVMALIGQQAGVTHVTSNLRTGSVVVLYDPEKIPRETLLEAAAALEKQFGGPEEKNGSNPANGSRKKNGSSISPLSPLEESVLLGGLFALTAIAGYGNRTLHVLLGASFAALAGVHLYDRKHCLTR